MQLLSPLTVAGAERVVLMLLRNIDRSLFDVSVCLFINTHRRDNPFLEELRKMDVPVECVYLDKIFRWRYVREVRSLLDRYDVGVVHTHSHRADITGYLAGLRRKVKLVSSIHGWTSSTGKVRAYEFMDRLVLRRFDRVLSVSEDIRNVLIRHGVDKDRVITLHNAIDFDSYFKNADGSVFRKELGIGNGDKLVGTVGRLSKEKGLGQFLKVARRIVDCRKDVRFVVVGDGPEREELIKLRDRLELREYVQFHGYVRDISGVYAGLDLFLLTSFSEGVPISLLEAAYFGKPCVATAVGGIPEIMDGVARLVKPGDADSMSDQAIRLLSNDSESEEYSTRLRVHLLKKCDPKPWILSVQDTYRRLATGS